MDRRPRNKSTPGRPPLSLGAELLVAALTVVVPVLGLCALSFVLLSAGSSRFQEAAEEGWLESEASTALLREIGKVEELGRLSIVSGAPVETALARTTERVKANLARAARFDQVAERESARRAAAALGRARDSLGLKPARGPAARLRRKTAFDAEINRARSKSIEIIEDGNAELRTGLARMERDEGSLSVVLYVAVGLSLLLTGFAARTIVRRVAGPLRRLGRAAERVSRGEAGAGVELEGPAEAQLLGAAFNTMARSVESNTAEMQHRALHDPLSRVGNRALLAERFSHAMARTARGGAPPSLLFVDLDAFKLVNDSLGHGRGDELLTAVAGRLTGCVRTGETVARVGGDEFALLVEWAEGQDRSAGCALIAERVLDALSVPFELAGRTLAITVSIGIAHAGQGASLDHLMGDADLAMYASKARGHGGYLHFDPDLQQAGASRLELIAELRQAVADESFTVHYQPIFDLQSDRLVAAEALVRWEHPERGMVAPAEFVPLAEESGLIVPLGRWVLRKACLQAAAWNREHPQGGPLIVAVNLSPRQFLDSGLIEDVRQALADSGLAAEKLTLEITETAVISNIDAATLKLQKLRELGVWIALDDFGTGHSSLSYLRRLPVTHLKVARPFVERMETSSKDLALVRGIIALTHGLDQRVIAEGVETTGQRDLLRSLGCDLGQGFLYAQPMPAHELGAALVKRREARAELPETEAQPDRFSPNQALRSIDHAQLIGHLPDLTIVLFDREMRFLAARGSALEHVGWREASGGSVFEVTTSRCETTQGISAEQFSPRAM